MNKEIFERWLHAEDGQVNPDGLTTEVISVMQLAFEAGHTSCEQHYRAQSEPVAVVCFDGIGDECKKCKGSGEIGGQVSYGMNEYGYETVDCPDCNGTGEATPQPTTDISELVKAVDGVIAHRIEMGAPMTLDCWSKLTEARSLIAKHTVKA